MKKIIFTALSIFLISLATFAQLRIETPALVAPADAGIDQMPNAILDWTAVVNATGYQVMVSTNENFDNPIVDIITPYSAFQNTYLMFNTTYYWKVRGVDGETYSDWTATRSFTTFTALVLDKPSNGATGEEAEIEFKWKTKVGTVNVSGFDYYQLQVDTEDTFTGSNGEPTWDLQINEGVFIYTLSHVYYGETLYWRMRAVHPNDMSDWSDVRSFSTDNQLTPKKPNNNSENTDLNVLLKWDAFAGTEVYDYQVHINTNFSNALMYFVDSNSVPVPQLKYGTTYYWHVRGQNVRDTSDWSDTWNFSTSDAVTLSKPLNMEDSVALKPQLKWSQIKGTDSYQIEYSTDSTFAVAQSIFKATNDDDTAPFYNVNTDLSSETKYFWRIRACTESDTSNYSEVWSFITIGITGINEYFNKTNVSLYPNPATNQVVISLDIDQPGEAVYSLTNYTGQVVREGRMALETGQNHVTVNLDGIVKGVYLMKLKNENTIYTTKLIIK